MGTFLWVERYVFRINDTTENPSRESSKCCALVWKRIKAVTHGWSLYMTHSIRNAGLGLSFLYMTVLGFDNITYAFCLSQCVTEWVLGVLVGVSAIVGVIGSLSFPFIRKRIGLPKTGLIGMAILLITLSLCVVSIWLDGSPFDAHYYRNRDIQNSTIGQLYTSQNTTLQILKNETNKIMPDESSECQTSSFLSVSVFLIGMILARSGLWISDLTITQTIQECHHYTLIKLYL